MYKEVDKLCLMLENNRDACLENGEISFSRVNSNDILNIHYYNPNLYDCEIATLWRNEDVALKIWNNVFCGDFFELKHPVRNEIKTRAVYSLMDSAKNAIFFIDKNGNNPWICVNFFGFAHMMFVDGHFFTPDQNVISMPFIDFKYIRRQLVNTAFNLLKYKKELFYKDSHFYINLSWDRPFHHVLDNLTAVFALELTKSSNFFGKNFWMPKITSDELPNRIPIVPRLNRYFAYKFLNDTKQWIYNDSLKDCRISNDESSLKIWLGIPGERRTWLTQLEGIPSILKNIAKYFPKIKVYVDGMTAYDGERIEVADNLKAFKAIKAEVDKLDLDIDMESLSGYDYRNKICYCSTCDIAISDLATTALTPFLFCKKPGVAFYQEARFFDEGLNYQKNIKSLYVLNKEFLITTNVKNILIKDFHIPWQHLYNLAAQSLEEIKGIKMHRLDVPPVELVAKQYDLEQELGIKIPIESIALFDEVKQELNKISKEQKSNKELLESIALFDEVKQELNKISKEQGVNKELLTQIISSSMILQNYVNNKNLQDQSIINQNKNLIAELLYCKEQNSILEQKLAPKAKSRIHNQLSYKLGQAMIANSKSIWGYIRMPYVLSYIKDMHKKEQIAYNEKIKANPSLKLPPLESYPDYKEALKEKECLTYKLGEAMIKADKSPLKLGYLSLWFKCKNIQKEFKKR